MSPASSIVVFDGVCHLCNGWVQFLIKRDSTVRFTFATMQSDAGRRLLQTHGLDPSNPVSFLLLDGNLAYTDTTAIVRVLEYLGGMWKVVAKIISWIPRSIRDPVYRFVARHRYKIFGRRSECVVPAPELARRFIQD